jgi:hypothetical protein
VAESPRWTAERLAGGLRVGVDASFAAAWSPTTTDAADPAAPFAGLIDSPNRFLGTTMSTWPCGEDLVICNALVSTALSLDDIGGRDVLYPVLVPEPALGVLLALGFLGLCRERPTRSAHDV